MTNQTLTHFFFTFWNPLSPTSVSLGKVFGVVLILVAFKIENLILVKTKSDSTSAMTRSSQIEIPEIDLYKSLSIGENLNQ